MSRVIIFHHNDLDGRCAAAIAYHWLIKNRPDVDNKKTSVVFREVNYQDKIQHEDITDDDDVYILDFSFKPEIMAEVRKYAGHVVWCDHHVTAKEYGYADLPGVRDFSEKGLSGCECTWKALFGDKRIPLAVELIGDYDSWRLKDQPRCFQFYEGMKTINQDPREVVWPELFDFTGYNPMQVVDKIVERGQAAIIYRDKYCGEILREFAYETKIDGHCALAMNLYRFGSKQFGDDFKKCPVCIAYIYNGQEYVVRLYSETVDVSVIAKKYGGGGHKGAAGFTCKTLPF